MKILLMDDEKNIRKLVKVNLEMRGFEVTLAENGRIGLNIIKKQSDFDLILLDVMMPEVDGLSVLYELKENPKTEKIPVFMLTAKGMMSDVERAFRMGADNYITKPFDPTELATTIKRKLRNKS